MYMELKMNKCIAKVSHDIVNLDVPLKVVFDILTAKAMELIPELEDTYLEHCSEADEEHRKSSRQYMHVGTHTNCNVICYASAAEDLEIGYKIGLIAHEFGHLALIMLGYDNHSEDDANDTGHWLTEIPIFWRGKEKLEWSPTPKWFLTELESY